ncbi:MAG: EscU/YscU/HrcU family type III secretion system export apparatus switch protein [Planctomycetota bacterium]|nr:MAG: EscU/YscU/HrcU family type III secretion system export apparatus switch protein [Planctomycetota bacterium]
MAEDRGDRTQQATPRKREEARKRGQVAHSKELSVALGLLAFAIVLRTASDTLAGDLAATVREGLAELDRPGGPNVLGLVASIPERTVAIVAAPVAAAVCVPVLAHLVQTRFLLATEALRLDPSRLDPVAGLQKLVSVRSAIDLAVALARVLALGVVTAIVCWRRVGEFLVVGDGGIAATARLASSLATEVAFAGAIVLLALGLLDYGIRWWRHEQDLKMSREEIKDEHKEQEGDPQLKARRERIRRELASMRMMADVPRADVVVRNPTHFAVALRYDRSVHTAPVVLAKGADLVALRIIAIAEEHGVAVVEDRPLARALHASVEIGQPVPPDLYRAVAEVLAYVYSLKKKIGGRS